MLLPKRRTREACHNWPECELKAHATTIQERTFRLRHLAMEALADFINDLKAAQPQGNSGAELAAARNFQRRAQFLLDFVEAENSMGFHAPQEAARILGESIDYARKGQMALRGLTTPRQ